MDKKDLYPYQLANANHVIENTHCALFAEMGLGKTVSTLTAINFLMFENLEIDRVLVIAPKRVVESVWAEECEKWNHLKHLKVIKIIGTEKQRRSALVKKGNIYLISRDNIAWLCALYGGDMLPFDMLVIDELSSFKNNNSVRFKALRKVQPSFNRIVGLTGTPAPNTLLDLWPQIWLLDRGERLGKFITTYRHDYFKPGKRNGQVIYSYDLRDSAEQMIYDKIGDICMSMSAKDYLDLPDKIVNEIKINFPDKLLSKYEEFEREKVLEMVEGLAEDDQITAVNAAALTNKLLQFANGAIYDEDKNWHEVHKLKIEATKELIEDANGKPVLIAWTYRHDLERLLKALKKYNPRQLKSNQDIEDWNAGKIQVLLMHPASGGHGLNLQYGGNIIIWFGLTWSLELFQQFNARLHRNQQKNRVVINMLAANKTMDAAVIKALNRKALGQAGLMEAVKARIDKYLNV